MLGRCYDPKNASFRHYGGRGITVCEAWLNDRDAFISWALSTGGGRKELSLDRIDNEKGYSPDNCRWATLQEQLSNQRRNRRITIDGVTKTVSEWARIKGLKGDTILKRISFYKIPDEKAFTPSRLHKWSHGTRHGYDFHKCRCEPCKAAHAKYQRQQRARRKERKQCILPNSSGEARL